MKPYLPIFVPLALLALGSCATSSIPRTLPPLNGMIYDYDNIPVASASVEVNGKQATSSDVNGRFALSDYLPGQYAIVVQKEGYETVRLNIRYDDPTQILYIKLFSVDQLLKLAESAFERRNWQETEDYLHRAELIQPGNVPLRFLQAALGFRRGNNEEAQRILNRLLADEANDPFIHVFLADLFQYRLNDGPTALRHLDAFLNLRYDPEIEKRRDELRTALQRK
jgi:hypothetical protein